MHSLPGWLEPSLFGETSRIRQRAADRPGSKNDRELQVVDSVTNLQSRSIVTEVWRPGGLQYPIEMWSSLDPVKAAHGNPRTTFGPGKCSLLPNIAQK